jgi:hypothetical protein
MRSPGSPAQSREEVDISKKRPRNNPKTILLYFISLPSLKTTFYKVSISHLNPSLYTYMREVQKAC